MFYVTLPVSNKVFLFEIDLMEDQWSAAMKLTKKHVFPPNNNAIAHSSHPTFCSFQRVIHNENDVQYEQIVDYYCHLMVRRMSTVLQQSPEMLSSDLRRVNKNNKLF